MPPVVTYPLGSVNGIDIVRNQSTVAQTSGQHQGPDYLAADFGKDDQYHKRTAMPMKNYHLILVHSRFVGSNLSEQFTNAQSSRRT